LQGNAQGASSAPTTEARQIDRCSSEDATFSKGLRYHQSKCSLCGPVSPNHALIRQNVQLARKHGPLSDEEVGRKLDLANYYLAAKDFDDAWSLYAEVLYRSYECFELDRLLVAVKALYSSIRLNSLWTAKGHFIFQLFINGKSPGAAAEFEDLCDNISHQGRSLAAQKALMSEIAGCLRQMKSKVDGTLIEWAWASPFHRAVKSQNGLMEKLLQWCLEQVEGRRYLDMLDSSIEKPLNKVPSLQSFENFERTALFCYLWNEYREAQRTQLHSAPLKEETIVMVVESLEQGLQIPAPMIFSTISYMVHERGAGILAVYPDLTPEKINRQAAENLRGLTSVYSRHYYASLFISAYFALTPDVEPTDEERQFRISVQNFVRQFAEPQLSQSATTTTMENSENPREPYVRDIASAAGAEGVLGKENVKDSAPALQQNGSATPTTGPQQDALLTDHEPDPRPASCVSVDMLATPRSSLGSSKASLRSFQRLGRVAELLLKRGDSRANQLPSEAMNRDSHSSWSLRRLTGISYLSAMSGTLEDYEIEEDTIMEDASLVA
jgi:hypothetical protein